MSSWPPGHQRATLILQQLGQLYPEARCSLDWRNPFQLLVATILSAQCTDKRVNRVTPALFARFPDAASFAAVEPEQVEPYVLSTGFYRSKARHIVGTSRLLWERHQGHVPKSMEALLQCPGVARKTANVVLATAYGLNVGVTVDTHVRRLSNRLGLVAATNPTRIEVELMALLPQSDWDLLSIRLIFHGRAVCKARRPACGRCGLADLCPSYAPDR
ncbi:MAG: endonuclease III [Candidatus Synechococcus spongiarum 142]|uniref:Endonuclease III n=1 Tax=Candidatus Synechococcus spongiarum 142 TaxID=1608213 RepID=A0A6N3WZZ9_9SYNE|nr:MAG: endonuclease III [Candidatus Synechococcus spongiarum 142]